MAQSEVASQGSFTPELDQFLQQVELHAAGRPAALFELQRLAAVQNGQDGMPGDAVGNP
jgi:hypothetical protein